MPLYGINFTKMMKRHYCFINPLLFDTYVCYNVIQGGDSMGTTNLNVRVDEDVKKNVEAVLDELGLNMSTAVNMFLRAVIREDGIPFTVSLKKTENEMPD